MNLNQLLAAIEAGTAPPLLCFYGHEVLPGGAVGPSCLSQWYPAAFTVDGVPYPTAEHWMMAGKARLFQDAEMLGKILAAPRPSQAKALGRKVRGFDTAAWEAARSGIVVAGNLAKFGQNPALRAYLLDTAPAVLVEASARDNIWGIGLGLEDPRAQDPRQWRGLNLLGFALVEVRERLA